MQDWISLVGRQDEKLLRDFDEFLLTDSKITAAAVLFFADLTCLIIRLICQETFFTLSVTHNVVNHLDVFLSFASRETTAPFSCSAFLDVPKSAFLILSYLLNFKMLVFHEDDTQAYTFSNSLFPVVSSSEYCLNTMDYTFMYHRRSYPSSQIYRDVLQFNILANNGSCKLWFIYHERKKTIFFPKISCSLSIQ